MCKSIVSIFLIAISFIAIGSVQADVIKYTDSKGYTFFVDSIDKVPKEYKSQVKNLDNKHTVSRVKASKYEKSDYPDNSASTRQKLEIFVTDWCGYCRALEADLKAEGIVHRKYNIETSEIGRKIYKELGGGGVPMIRVNGKTVFRGYSSLEPIKQALAAK